MPVDDPTKMEMDLAEGRETDEVLQLTKFSLDHAAISAYLIDKDAHFLYANAHGCHSLGYTCGEMLAMTVSDVDPDFPAARWPEHWAELQREGALHFETTHRRKNGELFPVEVTVNYLEYNGREYNWAFARDISERKTAEEALKSSYELTRTILDSMNDAIALIDVRDFRIERVNRVFLEEYGYTEQEEVAGRYCYEVTHGRAEVCGPPDDICPLAETLRTGEHHSAEHVHHGCRGEKFYVEVSTTPIKDEGGNIVKVVHVARNITERKLSEEALRESEEALRTVVNSTYDGILLHTPDGGIIKSNEKFLQMYQVGQEEIVHLTIADLSDPAMPVDSLEATWQEVLAGRTRLFEWRGRRKSDGFTFPVEVFLRRVRLGGRDLILANVRDISERKRAEEKLRQSEERYRLLADFTHDWEYWLDPQGRYLYVSPSCEKVTGFPPSRFQEEPEFMISLIHPNDRPLYQNHLQQSLIEGAGPLTIELRVVDRLGQEHWIEHVCQPVFGSDGRFLGRRGSNRDVTDRKRQEAELQKAQRLESIGILAGGIAHDFNNILTAIMGNLGLARARLEPGSQAADRLAKAEQAALRATGLSRQLLTFAKGGAPIKKAVSIPVLVQETVELALRGSPSGKQISLPPDLWPVEADESQLNQVISNIVINGLQAMPAGGTIEVGGANEVLPADNPLGLPAGRYVRIAIQDQGTGIPAQDLDRIFDPYFTTKEDGSGLGLAISHSIIKRHGGAISVDSVPGRGSTFFLYLPASSAEPVEQRQNGILPEGGGRILVMDDEETVREVAAEMLEHLGYQATAVRDGAEAVAAYRRALAAGAPYAAVITDLTVAGGMGGREATSRILALDPKAKVIVSSGYANDPILAHYREYGFTGFIPKPYKLAELGKVLQEAVGGKKG